MPAPEGGSGPAHSGHAHAQEGPCLQSGLKRIKVRVPPSKAGTGRSRATPAVRRRSGSLEPTSARRRFDGSASPLARSGEVVVGARIGIWWPADEAYYRVSCEFLVGFVCCLVHPLGVQEAPLSHCQCKG